MTQVFRRGALGALRVRLVRRSNQVEAQRLQELRGMSSERECRLNRERCVVRYDRGAGVLSLEGVLVGGGRVLVEGAGSADWSLVQRLLVMIDGKPLLESLWPISRTTLSNETGPVILSEAFRGLQKAMSEGEVGAILEASRVLHFALLHAQAAEVHLLIGRTLSPDLKATLPRVSGPPFGDCVLFRWAVVDARQARGVLECHMCGRAQTEKAIQEARRTGATRESRPGEGDSCLRGPAWQSQDPGGQTWSVFRAVGETRAVLGLTGLAPSDVQFGAALILALDTPELSVLVDAAD